MDGSAQIITRTLEDGVYFDLPFPDYLGEKRFSFHFGKSILISPLTAWSEYVDPSKADRDSTPMKMGRAFHTRILEGEAAFLDQFAIRPENDGDYLEGSEEIKARCAELDLKRSGTIAAMCERILDIDPDAKLWPVVMKNWLANNADKTLLKAEEWRQVELPARMLPHHPEASKAFTGGYPEVSVLWTDKETGIKCKSRLDYLKVEWCMELKTFSNQGELPISKAVARTLTGKKYHMQGRMELEAVSQAKMAAAAGNISGDVDPKWLAAFLAQPEHKFAWVFIQQGRVPEMRLRKFERYVRGAHEGATENLLWTHGWDCFRHAIKSYAECLEHYGSDPTVPWIAPEPMRGFVDEEFGAWSFE